MILGLLPMVVRVVVGLGSIVISNLVIVLFVDWRVLPVRPPVQPLIHIGDFSSLSSYQFASRDRSLTP